MRLSLAVGGDDWKLLGLMPGEWVWRRIGQAGVDPDGLNPPVSDWFPAVVPGDVPSDLRDAGVIPDPWFGLNSRACEWISERDWVYRKEFDAPADMRGKQRIRLRFGAVDFSCHVFLNGKHLGDHVGMYDPFSFDVTDALSWDSPNRLIVVIDHAPKEPENQGQIGWTNQIRLWKARFAYGWDWCTRMIPVGIWQDVALEADDGVRLDDVWIHPTLQQDKAGDPFGLADLICRITTDFVTASTASALVELSCGSYRETFHADLGVEAGLAVSELRHTIVKPRLWHANGSGEQALYTAHVVLKNSEGIAVDERTVRFGIRRTRFVPNDGVLADDPEDALPYVLEVNGIKTFIKGWNWAPIDQLYGRPHAERYRHAIRLAKEANCNLLRVWGGGLLERELFYDLCDEAGIMVWQEFIQSSSGIDNEPASDPEYIAYCRDQAEKTIVQKRNHPSLLLWCGGNELMQPDGTPLGSDHPTLAALKETVERLDPDRLWLPTSPSGPTFSAEPSNKGRMHDVHGDWKYRGDPDQYALFNGIDPLLHSEFGAEGAANREAFARFMPNDAQWPPDASNPHWTHHGAWWLNRPTVEKMFGPLDNLDAFVRASQWIQAEGLRYAVESGRRGKWRTAGTIPWQYNESWPNASCTNVLDYYGQPRPAYWWIRRAYAPLLVSARYKKLQWKPGEVFEAEVWLHVSASLADQLGGRVRIRWRAFDLVTGTTLCEDYAAAPLAAAVSAPIHAGNVRFRIPKDYRGVFALHVSGTLSDVMAWTETEARDRSKPMSPADQPQLERNEYLFSSEQGPPFASLMELPATRLQIRRVPSAGGERMRVLSLRNIGDVAAFNTHLTLPNAPIGIAIDGNYRTLLPREQRWFRFKAEGENLPDRLRVCVSAWNVPSRALTLEL